MAYEDISEAFPSLFSLVEMVSMDARVLAYWNRRAKIVILDRQLGDMERFRMSMHANKAQFEEACDGIRREKYKIKKGLVSTHEDSWDDLGVLKGR